MIPWVPYCVTEVPKQVPIKLLWWQCRHCTMGVIPTQKEDFPSFLIMLTWAKVPAKSWIPVDTRCTHLGLQSDKHELTLNLWTPPWSRAVPNMWPQKFRIHADWNTEFNYWLWKSLHKSPWLQLAIGKTDIDYFSLDVEGSEYKILKTIPWHKVDIKVLYYALVYLFSMTMFECHSYSHPMIEKSEIRFFQQKSNDHMKNISKSMSISLKFNLWIIKFWSFISWL